MSTMILKVLLVTVFCLLLWKTVSAFSVKCRTVPKIYVDSYLRMQMNIASEGAGDHLNNSPISTNPKENSLLPIP